MMIKLLAALALTLAACADQVGPAPTTMAAVPAVERVVAHEDGANICQLLPDEGPCSLACDPGALAEQYIAVDTCMMFSCTLSDGQTIRIGGCR